MNGFLPIELVLDRDTFLFSGLLLLLGDRAGTSYYENLSDGLAFGFFSFLFAIFAREKRFIPSSPPPLPPRISNFSVKEHRILSEAARVVTLRDGMKTGPRNDPISAGALFVERRRITLCKSGEI